MLNSTSIWFWYEIPGQSFSSLPSWHWGIPLHVSYIGIHSSPEVHGNSKSGFLQPRNIIKYFIFIRGMHIDLYIDYSYDNIWCHNKLYQCKHKNKIYNINSLKKYAMNISYQIQNFI